jgi:phage tail protein X
MPSSKRNLGTIICGSAGLLILTIAGCVLYMQWDEILLTRRVRQFVESDQPSDGTVEWLSKHRFAASQAVIAHLANADPAVARRTHKFIAATLAENPDPTNPEHSHIGLTIAAKLHQGFDGFSEAGRTEAASLAFLVLRQHLAQWSPNVPTALESAGELVCRVLAVDDPAVQQAGLRETGQIWSWHGSDNVTRPLVEEWKRRCYMLIVQQLENPAPSLRALAAVGLAGAPFHEGDMKLIGLLDDADPAVKAPALQALAHAADSLSAEHKDRLVTFLHDPDIHVQAAARQLLRLAGLSEAEIRLAALLKHPIPAERAKVVSLAGTILDDPALWVLALADDPSPAVRLSVARAACFSHDARLRDRAMRMATADEDFNVRQMTRMWLALRLQNGETTPVGF